MKKRATEWKVGLFVTISLTLLVGLIVKFSKGTSVFTPTYDIVMRTDNVSGLIKGAVVLMAGVPIGNVIQTDLEPSGKIVNVRLRIEERYPIHGDAKFSIRQMGFLGDRFVSVVPTSNVVEVIRDGHVVESEAAFDLQEVAQGAAGLLRRVDDTAKRLNDAVTRIDKTLFAEQTLGDLTNTLSNFRLMSEQALGTLNGIDDFVRTNTHPLSTSVSNLVLFSSGLNDVAAELYLTVATNRKELTTIVKNIESASTQLDKLVVDLQAGKGLAGGLLKDESIKAEFTGMVSNLNSLSSNLNKFGILWKPRVKRESSPNAVPYTGKSPHR
jgi:phospholipid/cholesterol/gamma-HCH transport system substrate-binding protein